MPRREDLPGGKVRVHFDRPILHFDKPAGFADFRPPTVGEVWDFGDPLTLWFVDESATPLVDRPALRAWIGRLIEGHDADMLARENDPALGILIEQVVTGFFMKARASLTAASAPASPPA